MANHFTLREWKTVSPMVQEYRSQTEIAGKPKKHPATISRELRRNRSLNGDWPAAAQQKADRRSQRSPVKRRLRRLTGHSRLTRMDELVRFLGSDIPRRNFQQSMLLKRLG